MGRLPTYPLAVGVRWSEMVEDGEGRLSRNGPSVGGAARGAEKPRGGLFGEPLLCGGIAVLYVCELENKLSLQKNSYEEYGTDVLYCILGVGSTKIL